MQVALFISNCSLVITSTAAFTSNAESRLVRPRIPSQHLGWSRSTLLFSSVSSTDTDNGDTASSEKETSITAAVPTSSLDDVDDEINQDDEYFDKLFDSLAKEPSKPYETVGSDTVDETEDDDHVKLVDFIEQSVGIQPLQKGEQKRQSE